MKGKLFVLLNCVFILAKLSCQGLDIPLGLYEDPDTGTFVNFVSRTQMEMWKFNRDRSGDRYDQRQINYASGGYTITEDNGVHFLTASWNNRSIEEFLVLTMHKGETLLLYKANGAPYFYGEHHSAAYDEWKKENSKYVTSFSGRGGMLGQRVYGDSDWFGDNGWIRASSTLTEGRTVYSTDKMGLKIGECWVEGARGQGINERLSLKPVQLSAPVIYISSGFVNFEKSYLYKENSRIKKIRVSNAFGNSIIIDLKDTPHFQPIDLTGLMPEDEIWWAEYSLFIDILDVYPGTKYTDTCVNSLYYPFSQ